MHQTRSCGTGHFDQCMVELFARDTARLVRPTGRARVHRDVFTLSPIHEDSHSVDRVCTSDNPLQPEFVQKSNCRTGETVAARLVPWERMLIDQDHVMPALRQRERSNRSRRASTDNGDFCLI